MRNQQDTITKRRWTLPSLGAAMFFLACLTVYVIHHWRQVRHDHAVEILLEKGAYVLGQTDDPFTKFSIEPRLRRIVGRQRYNRIPARWRLDAEVYGLNVKFGKNEAFSRFGDEGMQHVHKIKDLGGIDLGSSQVTDAGLVHLKGLDNLQELYLDNTKVTDQGLRHVSELPNLRILSLRDTQLGDDALAHLTGIDSLVSLDLYGSQVTDAGMKHLAKVKNLRSIDLLNTNVSAKAALELKRANPSIGVSHHMSHEVSVEYF